MDVYPIKAAIERGLAPTVYGDVALDEELGCTIVSTEELFGFLAQKLPVRRLVLVGEVDGVYERDPTQDPSAARIPRITPDSFETLRLGIGGSDAVDVTGGMLSKVQAMVSLVAKGRAERVHLISGRSRGALTRVLLDDSERVGTVIEREREPVERN
jgi:isopentenyl phosphate kinase